MGASVGLFNYIVLKLTYLNYFFSSLCDVTLSSKLYSCKKTGLLKTVSAFDLCNYCSYPSTEGKLQWFEKCQRGARTRESPGIENHQNHFRPIFSTRIKSLNQIGIKYLIGTLILKGQFANQEECSTTATLIRPWQAWPNILDLLTWTSCLTEVVMQHCCFLLSFRSTAGPKELSSNVHPRRLLPYILYCDMLCIMTSSLQWWLM